MGSGPVDISDPGDMTTILGTLNVDQAVSFDTTLTVAQTLTVTGVATVTNDLIVNGGDITHGKQHKEMRDRKSRANTILT